MIQHWWMPRRFVLAAAIVLLACVAGVATPGLAYPEPVSSAALGPDWQCSRLAFVWTTCRRVTHAEPAFVRLAKAQACPRVRA